MELLLYEYAIKIAIINNVYFFWLGVWKKNTRAISLCKKKRFVDFDGYIFIFWQNHSEWLPSEY